MSEQIDYGEPWEQGVVSDDEPLGPNMALDRHGEEVLFDCGSTAVARIVECVNEFAGIPVVEGTLAKVRAAIRDVTSDYLGVLDAHHMEQLESALAALTPKEKA
jgi:hypothetical protein